MTKIEICKFDNKQGIVYAWGVVSTVDDEPYYDLHGDYIPEDTLQKAVDNFSLRRINKSVKEMHDGDEKGKIVSSLVLTKELQKAFGIECNKTGWLVGIKVTDKEVLKKCREGVYTGFSIGGFGVADD